MRRLLLALLLAPALHAAAPAWVREAAATPIPAQPSSTKAVVLLSEQSLTVQGQDVVTRRRRVLKILAPGGRDHAYAAAYFNKSGKVLSMHGWIIDAAGKETELRERDAAEASATSFEVYSDARVRVLSADTADVGSLVAFEVEQREKPYEQRAIWHFQETLPVLRARFSIAAGEPYETKWVRWTPAGDGPSWELRDIPAIESEPRRPESAALAGWMGVAWGPKRTWSDVANWYASLASTQLAATPELTAKSKALADTGACARFAQFDVRYVAVEIGIGGYQPHTAAEIFRNRFGDCKDKATLLRAMLKERGIDAHYVLVNTTRGATEPSFPTVAAFNHVITAVSVSRDEAKRAPAGIDHPKLGPIVLFDPTSTTTPFGVLPSYLQGSRGLLVTTGELIDLPLHAPATNELRRTGRLTLDANGVLRGTIEETRTGTIAADFRGSLQPLTAADRTHFVESTIASHLGHHTTSDVKIEHLDDASQPLVIRYSIVATDYATRVADMLLVRPRVVGAKGEAMIDAKRKYAYVTEGPSLHVDEIEIAMPQGTALDELPKAVAVDTPHVRYTSASSFDQGVLRYRRQYEMKALEVAAAEVGKLNEVFAKINADERASAVFR